MEALRSSLPQASKHEEYLLLIGEVWEMVQEEGYCRIRPALLLLPFAFPNINTDTGH